MQSPDRPASNVRIWLAAVRPFAYTASVLTVVLGAAMAYHAGYSLRSNQKMKHTHGLTARVYLVYFLHHGV